MISHDSCRRDLSPVTSAVRHSIPTLKAMLTRASVAIVRSIAMSPNWSNKFLNLELFYKVVIATASKVGLSSLYSPRSAQITTAAIPFPSCFGSGFL